MDNHDVLIEYIINLDENFDTNNINDYKMLINVLYNNIMILEEENQEINQAIGSLLMHVYQKLDPHNTEFFDIREKVFTHYLQGWMKDKT